MSDIARRLGADKAVSTLLVLYIPSKDRSEQPIDQKFWVELALQVLGKCFGGATAFPQRGGEDAASGETMPRAACCSTMSQS